MTSPYILGQSKSPLHGDSMLILGNPPRHPGLNRRLLLQTASPAGDLRLGGEALQIGHANPVGQGGLVRRVQVDLGHDRILLIPGGLHGLLPARGAEAPLAPRFQADGPEVVAPRGGEVEEFLGQEAGDGVVAAILGADAAVAVAVEARHGRLGEEAEGFLEDCRFPSSVGVCGERLEGGSFCMELFSMV